MMRWMLAALLAIGLTAPAVAQDAPIEDVIGQQLEAFQRDDFVGAFKFASPMIKGMFGSPERFGLMVRRGYPMVWRPAAVQYLEQLSIEGRVYQQVLIRDQDGLFHKLVYEMISTENGWKINGVQYLGPPELAA